MDALVQDKALDACRLEDVDRLPQKGSHGGTFVPKGLAHEDTVKENSEVVELAARRVEIGQEGSTIENETLEDIVEDGPESRIVSDRVLDKLRNDDTLAKSSLGPFRGCSSDTEQE